MISVPSLLRLLSGSNSGSIAPILMVALLVFVSSCEILKPTVSNNGTVLEEVDPGATTDEPELIEKLDTVYLPPLASDTLSDVDQPSSLHPKIKIAVMLPFSLDRRSLQKLSQEDKNKRNLPLISLEMYEGMLLAVDSLRERGINLDLFVYDTENSTDVVRGLLLRPELTDIDLVIGPLFNHNIKLVSDWLKDKDALMLSPLSPTEKLVNNANFIMASNGPTRQCQQMAAHIKETYPGKNVVVLHQQADQQLVNIFSGFALQEGLSVDTMLTDYKFSGLRRKLSLVDPNVVVVPSFNEVFVNAAASKLSTMADSLDLVAFGMNDWQRYESISFDYLEKIDFHFVTDYWISDSSAFSQRFEQVHADRYAGPASKFTYKGYDLLYYFATLLDQHYDDAVEKLTMRATFEGLNNPYYFQMGQDATHFTNGLVHIIRYAENKHQKVN